MWIVDTENGHSLAGNGHPLGLRCSCGHRALIMPERIPERIGPGSMQRLGDQRWVCSICRGRRIELVMFGSTVQALAFADGMSYADLWDLRLAGKDLTEEPYCRYVNRPNPYAGGPHSPEIVVPVEAAKPERRFGAG